MAKEQKDVLAMEWRRARVSQKRQVTIPLKLFKELGIKDEVGFSVKDGCILTRPVREHTGNEQFSDLILADFIREGYQGEELLSKFHEIQAALRGAVEYLITDSKEAARQYKQEDQTKKLFGDGVYIYIS